MSSKRMFSLKIVDTDLFLEMPATSQLLYFHLSMKADDDGFVSNPRRILKMLGMGDDDLKVLIAKQYLIPFETGVCVIRHWHIHNLIRGDRYKETDYKTERSALVIENNVYEKVGMQNVIPNGNQLTTTGMTQVRLGKVRLGKVRLEKVKKESNMCGEKRPHPAQVFFNSFLLKPISQEEESYTQPFPFEDYADIKDLKIPAQNEPVLAILSRIVLKHFNWVTKSRFRPVEANLAMIRTCMRTGITLGDCFVVNVYMKNKWRDEPTMQKYIRIKTFYATKNFEQYLGEIQSVRYKDALQQQQKQQHTESSHEEKHNV